MVRRYGIYEVVEAFTREGLWQGYRCSVVGSEGIKEGKLYIKSDGRDFYKSEEKPEVKKGTSEDLEI